MRNEICPFCDPEKFVIYGRCKKCGREGEPPLFGGGVPVGFLRNPRKLDIDKFFPPLPTKDKK